MKYRDMFIYKEEKDFKFTNPTTSYYICEFVCDRPEKKCYLACTLGLFHNYLEIPYTNIDNIFDLAGFKKDILNQNLKIQDKLREYNEFNEVIKKNDQRGFSTYKFLKIYFYLKERADYLENEITKLKSRSDADKTHIVKQIEHKMQELVQVRHGIRKKYKRLHRLFLVYSEEELKRFCETKSKLSVHERDIKTNKEKISKIEKDWNQIKSKRTD